MAKIKSRIIEYKTIKASEIEDNANNWRTHPESQRDAMKAAFSEIGNIDVLKVIERDGKYRLIDGHLRKDIIGKGSVEVAVLDLTDDEADKALLTFDPISAIAERDEKLLADLVGSIDVDNDGLQALIDGMAIEQMQDNEVTSEEDEQDRETSTKEIDVDGFEMDTTCPKCGFEFDDKSKA